MMVQAVEHPVFLPGIVTATVSVTTLTTGTTTGTSLQDGAGNLTRNPAMMHTQFTIGVTTAHHGNGVATHLLKDCLVTTTSVLTTHTATEHLLEMHLD